MSTSTSALPPQAQNGNLRRLEKGLPLAFAFAGGLLLFALPYLPGPLSLADFDIFLLSRGLAFGVWAMGLVVLTGYTGLVSFGQSAWLGIGAYAGGYVARDLGSTDILVVLAASILICFAFSALGGFVVTRVGGVPFAIVTLAVAQITWSVFNQLPEAWLGGATGFFGVPIPTIFGHEISLGTELYLAIASVAVVVFLFLHYLLQTPYGRTLQAIRENEQRANFIGINVTMHKWGSYVISSVIGGIGGAVFVLLIAGISPHDFIWVRSGDVLIMIILGGLGSVYGPILGAVFFSFIQNKLNSAVPEQETMYLGLIFLGSVLFLGGGFAGILSTIYHRVWRVIWRISSP